MQSKTQIMMTYTIWVYYSHIRIHSEMGVAGIGPGPVTLWYSLSFLNAYNMGAAAPAITPVFQAGATWKKKKDIICSLWGAFLEPNPQILLFSHKLEPYQRESSKGRIIFKLGTLLYSINQIFKVKRSEKVDISEKVLWHYREYFLLYICNCLKKVTI